MRNTRSAFCAVSTASFAAFMIFWFSEKASPPQTPAVRRLAGTSSCEPRQRHLRMDEPVQAKVTRARVLVREVGARHQQIGAAGDVREAAETHAAKQLADFVGDGMEIGLGVLGVALEDFRDCR